LKQAKKTLQGATLTARHKFDVKHADFLDSPQRRAFLNPENILKRIPIKPHMRVADVGCGTGFFTIPMAKIVGAKGKVFAIDLQEEMIAILNKKIQKLKIQNIETLVSTEEKIPLPNESVDLALMASVLHELDSYATVEEVYRFLKPHGVLAVLEWEKKKTEFGPPLWERLTQYQTREIVEKTGFRVEEISPVGSHHYLVISVKRPRKENSNP